MGIKFKDTTERPAFTQIKRGLEEALAVAKGEAEPAAIHHGKRGRPSSGKQIVTLRLDPEIIAKFKATGQGWQARMNAALKKAAP